MRRSRYCLICNMGIPTLVRLHLYIETAPLDDKHVYVCIHHSELCHRWSRFPCQLYDTPLPEQKMNHRSSLSVGPSPYIFMTFETAYQIICFVKIDWKIPSIRFWPFWSGLCVCTAVCGMLSVAKMGISSYAYIVLFDDHLYKLSYVCVWPLSYCQVHCRKQPL